MKFNKWTLGLIAAFTIAGCSAVRAQTATTNSTTPPATFASSGVTLPQWVNLTYDAIANSGILQASNNAPVIYATYAPHAATKFGGGFMDIYNIPSLTSTSTNGSMGVGAALGFNWLGGWSLVSGSVTLKADTHPLAHFPALAFLPDSVRNMVTTPIVYAGLGQPMSGGGGAATIWDIGYGIRFGHWLGGQFGAGFTWGEWMNAGVNSGHRYNLFLDMQWGIPHS